MSALYSAHHKADFSPKFTHMWLISHYDDVIMSTMASRITSLMVVYSTVYSDADQRKHQSSASLAFVWGITGTGEFPAQRASHAENVSIWWRHHGIMPTECELSPQLPLQSQNTWQKKGFGTNRKRCTHRVNNGPIRFNIFVNGILLFSSDIIVCNYAGDACMSFAGNSILLQIRWIKKLFGRWYILEKTYGCKSG